MKLTPDARMEEHPFLLCAEWTNANHSLLVVRDYDLFFVSDPSPGNFHRITKTGIPGVVSNGAPDWLYEGKQCCMFYYYFNFYFIFAVSFSDCPSFPGKWISFLSISVFFPVV